MFVRFRQTEHRLQVSLVETRRLDGKVHHEHIASLGSIETPPTVPSRITFWQKLHERLGKLSNRVDAATQRKVLGEVHARIPMVTADEQRALQLENAEAEARFWSTFHDMNAEQVEGHKGLAALAERKIADGQSAAADAAAEAAVAKERVERIKRGENVEGGLGKPLTLEDYERILHEAGMTTSDIEHCVQVSQVCDAFGFETMIKAMLEATERARRNVVRRLHRRIDESAR
jgi:hypothetical protein